jgi:hypothetical protein
MSASMETITQQVSLEYQRWLAECFISREVVQCQAKVINGWVQIILILS